MWCVPSVLAAKLHGPSRSNIVYRFRWFSPEVREKAFARLTPSDQQLLLDAAWAIPRQPRALAQTVVPVPAEAPAPDRSRSQSCGRHMSESDNTLQLDSSIASSSSTRRNAPGAPAEPTAGRMPVTPLQAAAPVTPPGLQAPTTPLGLCPTAMPSPSANMPLESIEVTRQCVAGLLELAKAGLQGQGMPVPITSSAGHGVSSLMPRTMDQGNWLTCTANALAASAADVCCVKYNIDLPPQRIIDAIEQNARNPGRARWPDALCEELMLLPIRLPEIRLILKIRATRLGNKRSCAQPECSVPRCTHTDEAYELAAKQILRAHGVPHVVIVATWPPTEPTPVHLHAVAGVRWNTPDGILCMNTHGPRNPCPTVYAESFRSAYWVDVEIVACYEPGTLTDGDDARMPLPPISSQWQEIAPKPHRGG